MSSLIDCDKYSHIPPLYNFCETTFVDVKPNKTEINNFMNSFNFSDIYGRDELKEKIFKYILKNKKDFLKGKKDYNKFEIHKEVIYYLDIALQFQLDDEYIEHLILIYLSSIEKDILLHKDKFRKRVYLDFGYLNSDFKGDILRKKGDSLRKMSLNQSSSLKRSSSSLKRSRKRADSLNVPKTKKSSLNKPKKAQSMMARLSLSNKSVYGSEHIDYIINFFDEYVITYIHMNNEVIDNLEEFLEIYGYWVTEIKKLQEKERVNTIKNEFISSLVKKNIVGVIIPSSVTVIEDAAFKDCRSLAIISIPDSVTSIGDAAFRNCRSLVSITIPDSVTSIGESAFSMCMSVESISVSDSIKTIKNGTFSGCRRLTSIIIPELVSTIGVSAFHGCETLASITIPESVITIEHHAFNGCETLASITIPESVITIEHHAFGKCYALKLAIILNSKTVIDNCFEESIKVIKI